jgi:acyl-CoA reductase-like NAD-dependent aldehyde dehydrogenase
MQPTGITVTSPYDGKNVGSVEATTPAGVHDAVARARAAFRANRNLSSFARHKILKAASAALAASKRQIAEGITRQTGKPIKESLIEVDRATFVLEESAEEATRLNGEIFSCDVTSAQIDKQCLTFRRPVGVVAAITPFNFPLNIPAHKIGPAIASGNAVVLKPSPLAPLTAVELQNIFHEAGLPAGMLQVVQGGREQAEVLAAGDVNMVTFTGGSVAGENIARVAGMKKLSLELGDNGALIVLEDANIPAAVAVAIDQRFRTAGQRCTAAKRVFVHEKVADAFVELLCSGIKKLKRGDPFDESTDLGPLISEQAAKSVHRSIDDAVARGGKIVCGGTRDGAFIPPTVIENVPDECAVAAEEVFGPVLPIFRFREIPELVQRLNASQFGLQAGVFTNRLDVVKQLSKELEVGALIVNDGPGFRIDSIPFGGLKKSGLGREGVRAAVLEMTDTINLIF